MAFIDNRGYAVVDSNPNSILELQSGHNITLSAHKTDRRVWKYVPGNPAGEKWEIVSRTHDYYREKFIGLANESTHGADKTFSIDSIDMTTELTNNGLSTALAFSKFVLAGDGYLYSIVVSGGSTIIKLDPVTNKILKVIPVTGTSGGNFYTNMYRPADGQIYFLSDNGNIVTYDTIQNEAGPVFNSGLGTLIIRGAWANVEGTKIYGIGLFSGNILIFDIETSTFSTVASGITYIGSPHQTVAWGIGKDNIAYIHTHRDPPSLGGGGSYVYKFDCNTDTLVGGSELQLSVKGYFSMPVWDAERRYVYASTQRYNYTQGNGASVMLRFDTETYTEEKVFTTTDIPVPPDLATSVFGAILGLDGKIMYKPRNFSGGADDFIIIDSDGSNVAETFTAASVGLPALTNQFYGSSYTLQGEVYYAIQSGRITRIRYHDKMYEPLEILRYQDSLNYF